MCMILKKTVLILFMFVIAGCGGSGSGGVSDACDALASDTFNCDSLLEDTVSEAVLPLVRDFELKLTDLNSKVFAYCEDPTKLADAQLAWSAVMTPLQQLQVMNFGPSLDEDHSLLSFYDWETADPYAIDIAIAKSTLFDAIDLPTIDNEKDLVAVEYILFDIAAIQTYSKNENSNVYDWRTGKTGDQAQQDVQIQQDRCEYANLVTSELVLRAADLSFAWETLEFLEFFEIKQTGANEIATALFYVDKKLKDEKIKKALPQADDVKSGFKVEKLESKYANESKEALLNNLIGAKTLLTLNDLDNSKTGLDDYLAAAGQQDVADEMIAALDEALANVAEINNPGILFDAVNDASDETACKTASGNGTYLAGSSDIITFCALQYQVKAFTDILKGDFTFLTSFTIPASASGDND